MATKAGSRTRKSHHEISTTRRKTIPSSKFAFPKERKEPLTDARHVKNALARFDQVEGVSPAERKQAFGRIKRAAEKYGVDVEEKNWRELGKHPHTRNAAHSKKR